MTKTKDSVTDRNQNCFWNLPKRQITSSINLTRIELKENCDKGCVCGLWSDWVGGLIVCSHTWFGGGRDRMLVLWRRLVRCVWRGHPCKISVSFCCFFPWFCLCWVFVHSQYQTLKISWGMMITLSEIILFKVWHAANVKTTTQIIYCMSGST